MSRMTMQVILHRQTSCITIYKYTKTAQNTLNTTMEMICLLLKIQTDAAYPDTGTSVIVSCPARKVTAPMNPPYVPRES